MNKVKKAAIFLTAIGIVVFVAALVSREKKASISDFSWSVSGKTAPYSFNVANQTNQDLVVLVVLEAHRVIQGRDGSQLHSLGLAKTEISLMGREAKKEEGKIELLDFGNTETKVSYCATIKDTIQPVQKHVNAP